MSTISQTRFNGANLSQANFTSAELDEVDFSDANLDQVDFTDAELRGVIFKGAQLTGANLGVIPNLSCEQINQAKIDKFTKLPPHLEVIWEGKKFECKLR